MCVIAMQSCTILDVPMLRCPLACQADTSENAYNDKTMHVNRTRVQNFDEWQQASIQQQHR